MLVGMCNLPDSYAEPGSMRRCWIPTLSFIMCFSMTVACDSETESSDDDSPTEPGGSSESTQFGSGAIGASGGAVQSDDGHLRLTFPEGALDDETEVSIESRSGDHSDLISELYELEPSGVPFDPPVRVSFLLDKKYEDGTVAVARFDSGSPEILEGSSHWGEGVHVELSSFSTYGAVSADASPELSDRCEEVTVGGKPCTNENADEACTKFPDLPGTSEASFDDSVDFVPDYVCVCEQGDATFGNMRACWNEECQGPGPPCTQACEDDNKGAWTGDCYHPTLEQYRAAR